MLGDKGIGKVLLQGLGGAVWKGQRAMGWPSLPSFVCEAPHKTQLVLLLNPGEGPGKSADDTNPSTLKDGQTDRPVEGRRLPPWAKSGRLATDRRETWIPEGPFAILPVLLLSWNLEAPPPKILGWRAAGVFTVGLVSRSKYQRCREWS